MAKDTYCPKCSRMHDILLMECPMIEADPTPKADLCSQRPCAEYRDGLECRIQGLEARVREQSILTRELIDLVPCTAGAHTEGFPCKGCEALKKLGISRVTPFEKQPDPKPRICEDCGKQDASVSRATFKAGRFYLCHDCDRDESRHE